MKTIIQLRAALPLCVPRSPVIYLVIALCGFAHSSFGGPGSAVQITNSTSYVIVSNTLAISSRMTLEAWVRTTQTGRVDVVSKVGLFSSTPVGFNLNVTSGPLNFLN